MAAHVKLLEKFPTCASTCAYNCIRWEAGDLDEWSAITYPDKLHEYVTEEFRRIKKRQADLLGIKEGIRSKL